MLIGLIVSSVFALFFFVRAYKLAVKVNELRELVVFQELKIDANTDAVKEDFLKFVSDSREWAFDYIEEVQTALTNFKNVVGPQVEYFDKFGEVIWTPITPLMKEISAAYKELIVVLPTDENDKIKE